MNLEEYLKTIDYSGLPSHMQGGPQDSWGNRENVSNWLKGEENGRS